MNLEKLKKEICRPLEKMISPGPHAFLIVLSAAHRFTEEEQKTIEYINEMFGSDAGKYCILIITREEDILDDGKTVDQYFQESDKPLKHLLAQCQNRYLAINNRSGKVEHDEKVRQLVNIVRNMLKDNNAPYYTNEMFKQAEKEFEEKEIQTLNKIKMETEAKMEDLREEVRLADLNLYLVIQISFTAVDSATNPRGTAKESSQSRTGYSKYASRLCQRFPIIDIEDMS